LLKRGFQRKRRPDKRSAIRQITAGAGATPPTITARLSPGFSFADRHDLFESAHIFVHYFLPAWALWVYD